MKFQAALTLLLLAIHSQMVGATGPLGPKKRPLSDAQKYSRPVSEANPFGIDYGFDPYLHSIKAQGVPSHQLSMYHAQIIFAEGKCTKGTKRTRFQRGFRTIMLWNHDKDLDKPYKLAYAQAVQKVESNYHRAWEGLDESQRASFCAEYWNDVDFRGEFEQPLGRNPIGPNSPALSRFYLGALSIISKESIDEMERKAKVKEERDKILGPIVLLGQALALAAGVSAGNHALAAGRAGNMSIANMRFAQASNLLRISEGVGATGLAAMAGDPQSAPTQQPLQASCQTLEHFDQYAAEPDSDVWKTYQSFSSGCEALNSLRVK